VEAHERLTLLIGELNLDGKRLAESLGVSGASISDWKSGKQPIKKAICLALQALYGISWTWILDGTGPKWAFRPSGNDHSDQLVFIPRIDPARGFGPSGIVIPPDKASPGTPFQRSLLQAILMECGAGTVSDLFIVDCEGDAMRPTIQEGDLVLINTAMQLRRSPKSQAMFLVRNNSLGGATRIKRVLDFEESRFIRLTVDSPGYLPLDLETEDTPTPCLVLGRVCWISRNVLKSEHPSKNW